MFKQVIPFNNVSLENKNESPQPVFSFVSSFPILLLAISVILLIFRIKQSKEQDSDLDH